MSQRGKPRLRLIENIDEARSEIKRVGSDPAGIAIMAPKAVMRSIYVERLSIPAAQILKEEMLSAGGEVARAKGAVNASVPATDVLIFGTLSHYRRLIQKLCMQPFGLKTLADELESVLAVAEGVSWPVLRCGDHDLPIGERTLVMGVMNVTPDSFSGDGLLAGSDTGSQAGVGVAAAEVIAARARAMVEAGADIIDVGGESTRPGADEVSAADEIARVVPVIHAISSAVDAPVSIDTYKAAVAEAAIEAGATMVNDISGLHLDPKMAQIVAEHKVPLVVMHMKGTPRTMQDDPRYEDVMGEIIDGLRDSLDIATAAGIPGERLIVDPGIGFGKTIEHNLEILRRLPELKTLGRPILIGTSRKGFIGKILGLPPEERKEGTAATVAFAIARGADIVRVHDVESMYRVARMCDAMLKGSVDA